MNLTTIVSILLIISLNSQAQYKKIEWVSTTENMPWVSEKGNLTNNSPALSDVEIVLNKSLQTIEGFGACFNELGWTSLNILSEITDAETIEKLKCKI